MDRIKEITEEVAKLEKESTNIYKKIHELQIEKEDVIKRKIFDERLLNQFDYVYHDYNTEYISFKIIITTKGPKRDNFDKLLNLWPHSSFDLGDGAEVYDDDGELGLRFDKYNQGFDFIKKHNLQIDFSGLLEHKTELEESLKATTELLKKLGK